MATKPIFKDTDQGPVIRRKLNEMSDYFGDVAEDIEGAVVDIATVKQYRNETENFRNETEIFRDEAGESELNSRESADKSLVSENRSKASELGAANSRNSALTSEQNARVFRDEAEQFANQSEDASVNASEAAAEAILAVGGAQTSLFLQRQVFTNNIIIPTGYNALIIGEFSVQTGVTIEGQGTSTLRGL